MTPEDITSTLPRLLSTVTRPREFFATGAVDLPVIRAHVDGLGGLDFLCPLIETNVPSRFAAVARLVRAVVLDRPGIRPAVATLVEALPRFRPTAPSGLRDARAAQAQAEGLTDLAKTFDATGDPALASRAAALTLGDEGLWPLDLASLADTLERDLPGGVGEHHHGDAFHRAAEQKFEISPRGAPLARAGSKNRLASALSDCRT